jgi:phosphatidylglycerol---prolipoprotein diacylglyceryl transferase
VQQFWSPVLVAAISYVPLMRLRVGPLAISPHGVFIAVGFMVGAGFMLPQTRKQGIDDETIYPLFTTAALGALVGARLAYVLNHPSDYTSPLAILQVWQGGISLLGGMFGAVLACLPRIRARKLSFWTVMDAAAPAMALGVAIGRTGDLLIADHLGKVTSFALGYRCPAVGVETGSPCAPTQFAARTAGAVVHQTALYDQVLAALLLVALLRLRHTKHFDGFLILVFAAGYGLIRLFEDFLREDTRRLGLTASQWTALATVAVCAYVLAALRRTPRWGNWGSANGHSTLSSADEPAGDDGTQGPAPPPPSAPGA